MNEFNSVSRPEINYNSPEWHIVEEWLSDELLVLYRKIANIDVDEKMTNYYRGQASMIETMLSLRSAYVVTE